MTRMYSLIVMIVVIENPDIDPLENVVRNKTNICHKLVEI
jgi:hypothetical protein